MFSFCCTVCSEPERKSRNLTDFGSRLSTYSQVLSEKKRMTQMKKDLESTEVELADGAVYTGEMDVETNMRHGKGVLTKGQKGSPDYERYEGDWVDNKCHGYGVFEDAECVYEGEWKEGQKHGRGKEHWAEDNLTYEGEYVNGEKHGKGKLTWTDENGEVDTVYEGDMYNDGAEGYGRMEDSDGVYTGYFKEGVYEGEGKYVSKKDGSTHEGIFKEGELVAAKK